MTAQGDPGTLPRSQVLLELDRLDAGSAVALVGHPIHVMMVHFPIAFVIATLGVDVFQSWSGDPFWVRVGLWSAGFQMPCRKSRDAPAVARRCIGARRTAASRGSE